MAIRPGDPAFQFSLLGIALNAPAASGVYAICDGQGNYLYFGESNDIARRLTEHLNDARHPMHGHGASRFAYELHDNALTRVARQNQLIALYPCPCNQRFG